MTAACFASLCWINMHSSSKKEQKKEGKKRKPSDSATKEKGEGNKGMETLSFGVLTEDLGKMKRTYSLRLAKEVVEVVVFSVR